MINDSKKYQEFEVLEREYLKQFPKSEKPSNSLFELGIDVLLDGLKNRKGRKIRVVHKWGVCDEGKIVFYIPRGN